MADNRIMLLYNALSDGGAFAAGYGSWVTGLPLANLQNNQLFRRARSTNLTLTSTRFRIGFSAPIAQRVFLLGPHNGSGGMQYRIRGYSNSGYSSLIFDTGWIGRSVSSLTLPWETFNWWLGGAGTENDDPEVRPWIIHVFDDQVAAQYWQVEIDDTGNAAGYFEAGRLFMADWWEPSINYQYGNNGLTFEPNVIRETSASGAEYSERRGPAVRVFSFNLDHLPEAELYSSGYRMMRLAGDDREVFVIPDPADAFIQRRSFLGRLRSFGSLSQNTFQRGGASFELKERI
ncbi:MULTISPECIES: hypothetical protein [unclassified Chelatococcus]|uniref:hypothetical protein n=1 Tax=unclassified Chelatococcus TaxID=2638111 RepID=UPI001BCAAF20|nr:MULTISPECIES: hypothetical protein [unclassified Chelatococcus]MBS7738384.1 hypothetical protein [Chelatococcus sp. HY11]MBX3547346.1 hypothetical protein [Chelatococcus sp.]CAH1670817.1 conserved hypothetical protein [Hyphomicrobiales bacterium]CAH1676959.1 conserved hypothetical protein [Hyphomicrobiales bacterium]